MAGPPAHAPDAALLGAAVHLGLAGNPTRGSHSQGVRVDRESGAGLRFHFFLASLFSRDLGRGQNWIEVVILVVLFTATAPYVGIFKAVFIVFDKAVFIFPPDCLYLLLFLLQGNGFIVHNMLFVFS